MAQQEITQYSNQLKTSSVSELRSTLQKRSEASDIARELSRCILQFQDKRVFTPEQQKMMLLEWLTAFEEYSPEHLHGAITRVFRSCRFWPSIAEITDHLRDIRREALSEIEYATGGKRWRADEDQFAKNGRTEAEELAKRAADCKRWRDEFNFVEGPTIDPVASWTPASQDMRVSEHLRRTCAVRRSLGLTTCGENCAKQNCELREREESR